MLDGSSRTAATLLMMGAVALVTAVASPLLAQCAPATGSGLPFGPRATAADSGRLYTHELSADGQVMYLFKRVAPSGENYRIFRSRLVGGVWTPAEQLSFGGDYSDLYPSLSADGERLIFASYRPVPGDTSRVPNAHLWMSRRRGEGWSAAEFIPASRLGHYHSGITQTREGTLRFRLTVPDWSRAHDAELHWLGTQFETSIGTRPAPQAAEYWRRFSGDSIHVWGAIQGPRDLSLVSISRVATPGGRRSPALYFATYGRGDSWTPLVLAGGGLGTGSPNFAWFSADGCYLHYTRDYSEFMRVPVSTVASPPR